MPQARCFLHRNCDVSLQRFVQIYKISIVDFSSLGFYADKPILPRMSKAKEPFSNFLDSATKLARLEEADALMVVPENEIDWAKLTKKAAGLPVIVLVSTEEEAAELRENYKILVVVVEPDVTTISERLTQGILESVSAEYVPTRAAVVIVYSAYEEGQIDSISFVRMDEHLGKLTPTDFKKLDSKVPIETLKSVVELAIEIGREGREGKPIGTIFVVGDHRKAMEFSRAGIFFEMTKGYTRKERNISNKQIRESLKEISQLDGAFVISQDGTVEATCRILQPPTAELTISHGLGARHTAAAAISKSTKAVAIAVSESNGAVRIFQDGEVVLRIASNMRRAMKYKNLDVESAPNAPANKEESKK